MTQKIHFIAIGGSAMHNLALALHMKGFQVSGSDDEIFEPSRSRLEKAGILPENRGWYPEKITSDIDAVILGMHARIDNPELCRARDLGLKIYSYPEYLYERTKNKLRVIVGGSHGKTTTTSMIMHVLKYHNIAFDYMVGALVDGFENMVDFDDDARIAVFEGDEYLTSPIDLTPKFHHYHPHIAILTGIAWDHMNVFPTFENYVEQFRLFTDFIQPDGKLIYFQDDVENKLIAAQLKHSVTAIPYHTLNYSIDKDIWNIQIGDKKQAVNLFGKHNMQNLNAAYLACHELGVKDDEFMKAIATYTGASKRLQAIAIEGENKAFIDFAHSPSKLKATLSAVREHYPEHRIIACMELHTFSSLNAAFLPQYRDSMNEADIACVYYDPHVIQHKRLPEITSSQIQQGFNRSDLNVFTNNQQLIDFLYSLSFQKSILLIMTSGNFSGVDLTQIAKELIKS